MSRRAFGGTRAPFGGDLPGSPSNPYPSTEARNAAVPSPPNAVAWVAGDPVPTPYMLANGATGAADGDWVKMSGGSAAIAYGDLT